METTKSTKYSRVCFGGMWLFLLGFSYISPKQFSDYIQSILLESLDLSSLSVTKIAEDSVSSRCVYRDNNFFYKVWNVTYPRVPTFIVALQKGYFDHLALIDKLIVDRDGNCRGYIIRRADHMGDSAGIKCYTNAEKHVVFLDALQQNKEYRRLYGAIIKRVMSHGFVYLDFTPGNVIEYSLRYYLIDLESVYTVAELQDMWNKQRGLFVSHLKVLPSDFQ